MARRRRFAAGPSQSASSPTRTRCLSMIAMVLAWLICIVLGRLGGAVESQRKPPPTEPVQVTLQQRS